ncbi:MAG: putative ABC exporter domain-containing protein [Candidatus Omnitrophota bacterium]
MINSSLLSLKKLQYRARIRYTFRGLKTLRGAIYFALGVIMFCLWLGPQIMMLFMNSRHKNPVDEAIVGTGQTALPLVIFLFCLMQLILKASENSIYFTPSEVDFLFAGPFKRSELLFYKLTGMLMTTLFPAIIFPIFLGRFAHSWIALFAGTYLTLLFIQNLGMTNVMIRQIVTERAFTLTRKIIVGFVAAMALLGIYQVIKNSGTEIGYIAAWNQFTHSWMGTMLMAPFQALANAMLAKNVFPELLIWGGIAAAMNAVLLVLIFRLDANFLETAVAVSQRVYERAQQMKRNRGVAFPTKTKAGITMPSFPWLGGAGPILWRQFTNAYRHSKTLFILLPILCLAFGPFLFMLFTKGDKGGEAIYTLLGMVVWMSVLFTEWVAFDFRSEMERMDWLKILPIHSLAIALGEILVPVLIYTIFETLLFGGLAIFFASMRWTLLLTLAFLPLINFIIFGVDNFIFLVFPVRMIQTQPGDFQAFGRMMLIFMLKFLLLAATIGATAGLGWLVYWLSGFWSAFFITAWCLLLPEAILFIPITAWAYERFDLSVDSPAA